MVRHRPEFLQSFLDLASAAIGARIGHGSPADLAMRRVGAALGSPAPERPAPAPAMKPACDFLPAAIARAGRGPADVAKLASALEALAPSLCWRHRSSDDAAFTTGHANAAVVGPEPEALEQRGDVRIGISLMAPSITYPDHRHPPEEVYIVLSGGDWRQESGPWHAPGLGGIVYNPPDIVHAMRSGPEPLLAIWCLPVP